MDTGSTAPKTKAKIAEYIHTEERVRERERKTNIGYTEHDIIFWLRY